MTKIIVSTSISAVTDAYHKFADMKDWHLVVCGDKGMDESSYKNLKNCTFLSFDDQQKMDRELSDLIGPKCIQRRNFGFLWAYKNGADLVATVDSDNDPLPNWGKNILVGKNIEVDYYETDLPCFDPMWPTEYRQITHRGFPLSLVSRREAKLTRKTIKPDIQAMFWNGEPDCSAIDRLYFAPNCDFHPGVFPFASNKISPFNSQNTIISKEVLPHYFVFPFIGRDDDLQGSFYVQNQGFKVVYTEPTVFQIREGHSHLKDFQDEMFGYINAEKIIRDLSNQLGYLPENSVRAFRRYQLLINQSPSF